VEPREEIAADAALFALGQLDPEASASFEARLKAGCRVCQAEYASFAETAACLSFSAPIQAPRPALKDRLMAQIAGGEASSTAAAPHRAMTVVRSEDSSWMPGPAPGIEVRFLHEMTTMMVRMAAGARLPVHHHHAAEQCLIVEGSVTDGTVTAQVGDYIFMPAGSTHSELWSVTGTTFLISYS
jgi:quercetin dioxygenase-like cupin family protein